MGKYVVEVTEGDDASDDCDQHRLSCLIGYGFYRALTVPWNLPRRFDDPRLEGYAPYPFADGPALLRSVEPGDADAELPRRVALDVAAESGFLLEGVVPVSVTLRAHLPLRFELNTAISLLSDVYEQDVEHATVASAHVLYRHAQTRRAELRSGFGARLYVGDVVRAGFDVFYGIDGYFARRGIVRVDLHGGSLGRAFVGEARLTLGVMVRRTELYAGYDHTAFFGETASRLGGPIAGVRTWF